MQPTRILGIDPGLARMGYGVIDLLGNQLKPIVYGCIETEAGLPIPTRLQQLYQKLTEILITYQPQVMAVEELFYGRNVTTAFSVGQARGVAVLASTLHGAAFAEYTPMQVKQAVVGYGKADKQQIQYMVRLLLNLAEVPKPDDTADALAIAITHAHTAPIVSRTSQLPGSQSPAIRRRRPVS